VSHRVWFRSLSAVACFALVATLSSQAVAVTESAAPPPASAAVTNPDGTHTVTLDLVGDTWVSSSGQTTSQATSPELRVGSNNLGLTKARSYLDFDYSPLAGVSPDAVVTSAELRLSNFLTGSCAGTAIRASRVTGAWTLADLKWGAQPAVTTTGAGTSTAAFGASACPAEGTATFDMKAIVSSWLSGTAKRGVQIRAEKEGAATGYRKYRSVENGDPAKAPTLTITYDSYPATPTDLKVAPGQTGYAISTMPALSALVSDPDGGPVRGFFEVRSGSGAFAPIVWSGSSAEVASGERATVTVPDDILEDTKIYSVAAYSQDVAVKSKSAVVTGFKVDLIAPVVVITSNVFTDGQWKNPMPSSATFTLNGSADTSGFIITMDGTRLPNPAKADGSGDYTITWTPTAGWHTLEVQPADKAGNLGDVKTFSFGTGSPVFTLPTEWEASTADFPVFVSGPPDATGAALLWRAVGDTVWHTAAHISRDDSAWDGSVTDDGGRAVTGLLTWHATQETFGTGKLTAPALVQVRGCFQYAAAATACTADRYVSLAEEPAA
jgi:hypothetical protein